MEQLQDAVKITLGNADPGLVKEALAFCDQFKQLPDAWAKALAALTEKANWTIELRFFLLQVLEDSVRNKYGNIDNKPLLRETLWSLVKETQGQDPPFIRTKVALLVVLLVKHEFPESWPSFFADLVGLVSASIGTPTEQPILDIFLRICFSLHEEVVCVLISRDAAEHQVNTKIKDAMREEAVYLLASAWFSILERYSEEVQVVNQVLLLIGSYVSWADISLFVRPEFTSKLLAYLAKPHFQIAACECLCEIVSKGMPAISKIELIRSFQVIQIVEAVPPSDIDFREHLAKLVNCLGIELIGCCDDVNAKQSALVLFFEIFPHFLKYLGDEYDDVSSLVFPLLASYLGLLKKLVRSNDVSAAELEQFNASLLRVIIIKMKYDQDTFEGCLDEDEAMFQELRKTLKGYFDSLCLLYPQLFASIVPAFAISIFERFERDPSSPSLSWTDVELAVNLTYIFGEANKGTPVYVDSSGNPSALGSMLMRMINSRIFFLITNQSKGVSTFPHEMVQGAYFEVLNRYWQFFEIQPHLIPETLESFVDVRGLHHPQASVRNRVNYLFLRFIKSLRPKMSPFLQTILVSIQDLLVVEKPAMLPGQKISTARPFDSQLYLFEALGLLISHENVDKNAQVEYLQAITSPILVSIQQVFEQGLYKQDVPPDAMYFTQYLHDLIMALGAIAKGFPDFDASKPASPCHQIFQKLLQGIIVILESIHDRELIRDAVRFTFQRMVGCMGPEILNYMDRLFKAGLFSSGSVKELVEFMNFLGLTIFKFKDSIFAIIDSIFIPLMEKIFFILNQPPSGTDEAIASIELRKAYLGFISALLNAELDTVLTMNRGQLQTIVQSVIHYVQDTSDNYSQKLAFAVLNKMVVAWGGVPETPVVSPSKAEKKAAELRSPRPAVPGFEQFIYETIIPLAFQVPSRPEFNLNDGQSILMLNEVASLHKVILKSQGAKYLEFLRSVYLPSLSYPPHVVEQVTSGILSMDQKDLRKLLLVPLCFSHQQLFMKR